MKVRGRFVPVVVLRRGRRPGAAAERQPEPEEPPVARSLAWGLTELPSVNAGRGAVTIKTKQFNLRANLQFQQRRSLRRSRGSRRGPRLMGAHPSGLPARMLTLESATSRR